MIQLLINTVFFQVFLCSKISSYRFRSTDELVDIAPYVRLNIVFYHSNQLLFGFEHFIIQMCYFCSVFVQLIPDFLKTSTIKITLTVFLVLSYKLFQFFNGNQQVFNYPQQVSGTSGNFRF